MGTPVMLSREDLGYLKLSAEARGSYIPWGTRLGHICQAILVVAVGLATTRFLIDALGPGGLLWITLALLLYAVWILAALRLLTTPSMRLFQRVMWWFDERSGEAESSPRTGRGWCPGVLFWETIATAAYLLLVALWVGLILFLAAAGVFVCFWSSWFAFQLVT